MTKQISKKEYGEVIEFDLLTDCKCAELEAGHENERLLRVQCQEDYKELETRFTALKSEYDGIWGEKEWQRLRIEELERKLNLNIEDFTQSYTNLEIKYNDLRTALKEIKAYHWVMYSIENYAKKVRARCKEALEVKK